MFKAALSAFAAFLLAFSLVPNSAQAQRVFVSARGRDANPCTFRAPCRTFQHTHNIAPPNGMIEVLDPADYGRVTITKAISIEGHGFGGISAANGTGITINAGETDKINLRGLLIDGVGSGQTGIKFNTGGSVNIQGCLIRDFALGDGLAFNPSASSSLFVSDTLVADNRSTGILVQPSGSGTVTALLERVQSDNNANGFFADNQMTSGALNVTISDSIAASNSDTGIAVGALASGAPTAVMVRNSIVANNGNTGIATGGPPTVVRVSRSTITGNVNLGWVGGGGATLSSYGDNNVHGNGTDGLPTNTIPFN